MAATAAALGINAHAACACREGVPTWPTVRHKAHALQSRDT